MAEMSAVDWLKDNLPSLFEDDSSSFYADLFDQAKGMEKHQIISAYLKEKDYMTDAGLSDEEIKIMAAKYYNDEYNTRLNADFMID